MHYLPLIPRLKRLYASTKTAEHMVWHSRHRQSPGVMENPSDGEAWKHFDEAHPNFASEARNVRLALCADGFTPYSHSASPYSCWPVIVTPYNLPPNMCMTSPFLYLTIIIPGPNNPKGKIDVYLQPLIDELKLLWSEGVLTYDIFRKENFTMRAALMWTIGDFPAYGMLSGWMTAGRLTCPYCMELTKSFFLKNGRKHCWFDCHRQFLPSDHPFRNSRNGFKKNTRETSMAPPRLFGDQLWERIHFNPKITDRLEIADTRAQGYGQFHNWTK